jgi:hypothetical protein
MLKMPVTKVAGIFFLEDFSEKENRREMMDNRLKSA